ncbi:hypothetical protein CXB51_036526 [Gossypium anomalum]|uniref:Uncharacterized protein n=1 Tax=Gossypium anomalum TaxID=47600 RepID=A0A8J5Y0K0_9ROSI|nr:hypothetical protein CXB51_036526 [Gossypium anomalum]
MVNQGFIGPQVRDFHSQALNRYQVSIMTKQAEIQRLPNTGTGYGASCGARLVDLEAWAWLWRKEAVQYCVRRYGGCSWR